MKKIGIVCNDWQFFRNKYEALKKLFDVRTFRQSQTNIPIERYQSFLYKKRLLRLMRWSELTFFEFANKPLVVASHLKKVSKIVVRLHRYEVFKWAGQIDWRNIDQIVFVCDAMRNRFLNKFPPMYNKTIVIYNDIDTEIFLPQKRKIYNAIGIAGEITPRKRVYELILIFYELTKIFPELSLRICGPSFYDEVYYKLIKEIVDKLDLNKKVIFDGHLKTKFEMVNWYNKIDILICNSIHESFHYTSHEAMACECYTLSYIWDGAEEFFEEDQMYTTNSDLIDKIKGYYFLDTKTREQLTHRLRNKIIDKYDSKKQVKKLVTLIKDL
jgi:glycosyltransferase involved in cell wall biosynthesis